MAELIFTSSSLVLLNARDLLDQRIIEEGIFRPCYKPGDVKTAIKEMIELMQSTLQEKNLKIKYDTKNELPPLIFDKHRL